MCKYTKYIELLSWNTPKILQEEAINFLINVEDWEISGCIKNTQKDVWDNILLIISKRSLSDRINCIPDLLFLLKDLNWPGALKALEILKSMKAADVIKNLEQALKQAYDEKDGIWISNLKELVKYYNFSSKTFTNISLNEILSLAEW